jgi:hypothetical protein
VSNGNLIAYFYSLRKEGKLKTDLQEARHENVDWIHLA